MEPPTPERKLSESFVFLEETHPWDKLSDDVVVEVLLWLEPMELAKMASVCKRFNRILHDKSFREFHRLKVRRIETRMAEFKEELSNAAKVPKAFKTGGEVVGTIVSAAASVLLLRGGLLVPTAASAGGLAGRVAGEGLGRMIVDSFYTRWIEKKKHPLFREDDNAPLCRRCSVAFSITTWRQHCRACGAAVCSKCLPHEVPIPEIGYEDVLARTCTACYTELQQPGRRVVLVGPEVRSLVSNNACTILAAEESVFQHMYKCLRCDVQVCASCIYLCHVTHPQEEHSTFASAICACSIVGKCKAQGTSSCIEEHTKEQDAEESEKFAKLGQAPFTREEIMQLDQQQLLALFTVLDMDGDGTITADDWRAWKQHHLPAVLLSETLLSRDDRFFEAVAPHGVAPANLRIFLEMLVELIDESVNNKD